jgi:hypothetical protein
MGLAEFGNESVDWIKSGENKIERRAVLKAEMNPCPSQKAGISSPALCL